MKKVLWSGIAISLLLAGTVYFSWQKSGSHNVYAEFMSNKEAQTLVQDRYQGTVTQIRLENQRYEIEFEKQDNHYQIKLDAANGKVISFKKISSSMRSLPVEPPPASTPLPETQKKLTEAEAGKIAQEQINGLIDHIWLETKANITYYLVELKMKDNRKAVVQIHAITGNVISISWDNHDKGEDNDDRASNSGKDASKMEDD